MQRPPPRRPQARYAAFGRLMSHAANAGNNTIAPIMFTMNMKVSITPISAWNLSGENTQVTTPIPSVMPVKMMLAPVTRIVRT